MDNVNTEEENTGSGEMIQKIVEPVVNVKRVIMVAPIDKEKWHGNKDDENIAAPKAIRALPDRSHRYKVNISEKRLKELGVLLGQNTSTAFVDGKYHEFWDAKGTVIKLQNKSQAFDLSVPMNEIKHGILLADSMVANSMLEYTDGLWPEATHYIQDSEAETLAIATKDQRDTDITLKIAKLDREEKNNIIQILAKKDVSKLSDNFAIVEMAKLKREKPEELLLLLNDDRVKRSTEATIMRALETNVLKRDGMKIKYFDHPLGVSVKEVVEFFARDENQNLLLRIIGEMETT